jgi:Restriction Endonuclease associating with ARP
MPMTNDPQLLVAAFGEVLQIAEPLPIEDDRYLTFEYIGAADHLAEARPGIARQRGRFCTSTDAAICYRRPDGGTEIALIEWKYTESYKGRAAPKSTSDDHKRGIRRKVRTPLSSRNAALSAGRW